MNNIETARILRGLADEIESPFVDLGGTVNVDVNNDKRLTSPHSAEFVRTTTVSIELEFTKSEAEIALESKS